MAKDCFWQQIATYCAHVGPVVSPLIEKVGHTAYAIDRANKEVESLEEDIQYFRNIRTTVDV